MADESLDNLLELEQKFYQEGYDAGVADGHGAGLTEGKIFGIEKGYEKAMQMGRLHGRAKVWNQRLLSPTQSTSKGEGSSGHVSQTQEPAAPVGLTLEAVVSHLEPLPENARIRKHIENLLQTTDGTTIATDNSDEALADFYERITRATAKSKVISQIVGEEFNPVKTAETEIEDWHGLSARH